MNCCENCPRGQLIVISGPSGVGKGTVVSLILETYNGFSRSKSLTTRPRRDRDPNDENMSFATGTLSINVLKRAISSNAPNTAATITALSAQSLKKVLKRAKHSNGDRCKRSASDKAALPTRYSYLSSSRQILDLIPGCAPAEPRIRRI